MATGSCSNGGFCDDVTIDCAVVNKMLASVKHIYGELRIEQAIRTS